MLYLCHAGLQDSTRYQAELLDIAFVKQNKYNLQMNAAIVPTK